MSELKLPTELLKEQLELLKKQLEQERAAKKSIFADNDDEFLGGRDLPDSEKEWSFEEDAEDAEDDYMDISNVKDPFTEEEIIREPYLPFPRDISDYGKEK
jgi:hypothetical protein